jgi:hypothetical protein
VLCKRLVEVQAQSYKFGVTTKQGDSPVIATQTKKPTNLQTYRPHKLSEP